MLSSVANTRLSGIAYAVPLVFESRTCQSPILLLITASSRPLGGPENALGEQYLLEMHPVGTTEDRSSKVLLNTRMSEIEQYLPRAMLRHIAMASPARGQAISFGAIVRGSRSLLRDHAAEQVTAFNKVPAG
jgi:hypothetical protein